jgi:hypothetical protein
LGERAEHRENLGAGRGGHGETEGAVAAGRGRRFLVGGGHSGATLGRGGGCDNPGHQMRSGGFSLHGYPLL